ncbi:MAG TPA: MlaD family protein [Steroidobacteraceae bacterium]|jgi:paraquat-inducible protein B|nr:MlaD family protein [Steroidobacteraceae bacterium]
MSEPVEPTAAVPTSLRRRSRFPNLVWAIPIAALIIVAYLGVQSITHRGEIVTVTFERAAGARPGDTKVLYQGVEAGQLVKIEPNQDGRSLDFKLRMVPEAKAGLNSNARFWLIGASPTFTDLSSLKAVFSGVAIGYAAGEGGTPETTFRGLEKVPIVLPSDKGVRYRLGASKINSVHEGSVVLFHGQAIGKVSEIKFDGKDAFIIEIFVFEPFDALITTGARFWKISPVRLHFNDGITASFAPAAALLAGGIDVDVLADGTAPGVPAPPEQSFVLYESRSAARAGLAGPTVPYEFLFRGDAGELERDAAVTLLGFEIGEVRSVRLTYDPRSGEPQTIAVADIYPQQLHLEVPQAQADGWRAATDAKLLELVRLGFRAQVKQVPALLGEQTIALVKTSGLSAARLEAGEQPRFPTIEGGGLQDLNQLLGNLNAVPFAEIGNNVRTISSRLRRLFDSPDLQSSLTHLSASLASLDSMLNDAKPQVGPLLEHLKDTSEQLSEAASEARRLLQDSGGGGDANLSDAIQQLSDAARSIRSLTDYLSRHPEALLRGKRPQ